VWQCGALLYALKIPERFKPGAFDLAFHSHQIFHVLICVAACVHYKAISVLVNWRDRGAICGFAPA
jgi:adiponectin receptor